MDGIGESETPILVRVRQKTSRPCCCNAQIGAGFPTFPQGLPNIGLPDLMH